MPVRTPPEYRVRLGQPGMTLFARLEAIGQFPLRRTPVQAVIRHAAGRARTAVGWLSADRAISRRLVALSVLLPLSLTSAWLIGDAVQPASYSPVRQTVSVLAGYAGTDRWIVTGALFVVGLIYVLLAVRLASGRKSRRPRPVGGGRVRHRRCRLTRAGARGHD